jgi:hypothetical protein
MGPGSRIQVVRRQPMGSSHLNHALTVVDWDGRVHRLVLRRWARPGWDRDAPDYTAAREMTILELLRPTPVPAPVLVGADIDGVECGVPTPPPDSPPRTSPNGCRHGRQAVLS